VEAGYREEELMNKQTLLNHPVYNLLPTEIGGFYSLAEAALLNAGAGAVEFGLFLPPPRDLFAPGQEALLDHSKNDRLAARSSAIILARKQP
jgi:hypothetical protein